MTAQQSELRRDSLYIDILPDLECIPIVDDMVHSLPLLAPSIYLNPRVSLDELAVPA